MYVSRPRCWFWYGPEKKRFLFSFQNFFFRLFLDPGSSAVYPSSRLVYSLLLLAPLPVFFSAFSFVCIIDHLFALAGSVLSNTCAYTKAGLCVDLPRCALSESRAFQPCRVASAQDPGFPGWAEKSPLPLCSRLPSRTKSGPHCICQVFVVFGSESERLVGVFPFPEGQIDVSSWFMGWSDPPLTWGIQGRRDSAQPATSKEGPRQPTNGR